MLRSGRHLHPVSTGSSQWILHGNLVRDIADYPHWAFVRLIPPPPHAAHAAHWQPPARAAVRVLSKARRWPCLESPGPMLRGSSESGPPRSPGNLRIARLPPRVEGPIFMVRRRGLSSPQSVSERSASCASRTGFRNRAVRRKRSSRSVQPSKSCSSLSCRHSGAVRNLAHDAGGTTAVLKQVLRLAQNQVRKWARRQRWNHRQPPPLPRDQRSARV